MQHFDSGCGSQAFSDDVASRSAADRTKAQIPRLLFREFDEIGKRSSLQIGAHREAGRQLSQLGDRGKLGKLEWRVFLQANGLDGARDRKQDRIPIRLGLRDRACADSARSSRLVLDDDGLTYGRRELLGDDTR